MAKADEVQPRDKKTGVVRDGYDIYFYFEDGQQAFGYQEIDGNHYFFDRETGKMLYDSEKVVIGYIINQMELEQQVGQNIMAIPIIMMRMAGCCTDIRRLMESSIILIL